MARGVSTPAIAVARSAEIPYAIHLFEAASVKDAGGWGVEAARVLGLDPARVFKTLIVLLDGRTLAVAVIPVAAYLNLKAVAGVFGAREARMADPHEAERATGYVVGGISPLGQRRRLPTVIDASGMDFETIHVSAGRRGLEIELSPDDLARLTGATVASLVR